MLNFLSKEQREKLFNTLVKNGIWAILFVGLFVWTIRGYEARETKYMEHEIEYHKLLSENQTIMKEYQLQLNGFKKIIEENLKEIKDDIKDLRSTK